MSSRALTLSSGKPFDRSASASLSCNLPLSAEQAGYFCCGMLITHQNRFLQGGHYGPGTGLCAAELSRLLDCIQLWWDRLDVPVQQPLGRCWQNCCWSHSLVHSGWVVAATISCKEAFLWQSQKKECKPLQVPGEPGCWQLCRACCALHGSAEFSEQPSAVQARPCSVTSES